MSDALPDAATQAHIYVDDLVIPIKQGETVLEALEQAEVAVMSGCRAGTCCKCLIQADGDVPPDSQRGLRKTLSSQGYFLACQARPTSDIHLRAAKGPDFVDATLESIEPVGEDIARLLLRPDAAFCYRPGQYVDLLHPNGLTRSYSIASLASTGVLELHVRKVPDGLVSGWLHGLSSGHRLQVRGPFGQCFYFDDDLQIKLLLIGAGTGLAPLLGITRDALDQGHEGAIDLIHGGLEPNRLYLGQELDELAEKHPQLRVHRCVLQGATERELEGQLDQIAIKLAGPLKQTRAYLCGDDAIVNTLQRSLFIAGMASAEIHADPFTRTDDTRKASIGNP